MIETIFKDKLIASGLKILTFAVEGCSYAEGAQRCSNAAPL